MLRRRTLRQPAQGWHKSGSYLIGTFTDWNQRPISFARLPDGNCFIQLQIHAGHYQYAFAIDGEVHLDPQASGSVAHPRFHQVSILSINEAWFTVGGGVDM